MAASPAPLNIREAVVQALQHRPYQAMDLLVMLGDRGYSDSEIKVAISELIHEGKLELTSSREIRIPAEVAA
jgi:hypothetical protein